MQKVTGFGGFFFRARDPQNLAKWYLTHLGIDPVPQDAESMPWTQGAGPTVFAPFDQDTDYFSAKQPIMLNFRVRNLDEMISQLASSGIDVSSINEMAGVGRFARLDDPEGNPIELWQPA